MSERTVLEVKNVSQRFSRSMRHAMRYGVYDIFRQFMPFPAVKQRELRDGEFWALRGVSFDLRAGESLGILGNNGAGKSTLLKLIAGIYRPTVGHIRVGGRIGAIVELGSAFSPNLSGRENVRIQALLHGYSPGLLKRQMEAILSFADLGEFIDSPVQQYSTGMRARLGFSVAVHGNPDLLLVDEVLAVGDLSFQNKCLRQVDAYRQRGGAVVFVGHNPFQMQASCDRGIVLDRGRVQFDGSIVSAIDHVLRNAESASPTVQGIPSSMQFPFKVEQAPVDGGERSFLVVKSTAIHYERPSPEVNRVAVIIEFILCVDRPSVRINGMAAFFHRHSSQAIAVSISEVVELSAGLKKLTMEVPYLTLLPGNYSVKLCLLDEGSSFSLWNQGWSDKPLELVLHGEPCSHANIVKSISSNFLFPGHMCVEDSVTSETHG